MRHSWFTQSDDGIRARDVVKRNTRPFVFSTKSVVAQNCHSEILEKVNNLKLQDQNHYKN